MPCIYGKLPIRRMCDREASFKMTNMTESVENETAALKVESTKKNINKLADKIQEYLWK